MALKRIAAPVGSIVTLAEAKAQLRVEHASEDALIQSLIATAESQFDGPDGMLQGSLLTQTWEMSLDAFPMAETIRVPLPPLRSVTEIRYLGPDGVWQTMPPAEYVVDEIGRPGRIGLPPSARWPTAVRVLNAVRITFEAGYGAAGEVPRPIKQAILLLVGHFYEHREALADGPMAELILAIDRLLAPYRWRSV